MLDKIRTFSQYRIVKWLFAIFLVIPFGLFGIDYYFRTPLGGDTIATVGGSRVSRMSSRRRSSRPTTLKPWARAMAS